jgi:phytoene dehydrogenase-like protein
MCAPPDWPMATSTIFFTGTRPACSAFIDAPTGPFDMKSQFDIVVAGGGHNTLTAAAYLATAGLKVLVLERNEWIGGGVVTRELTAPGFRHDQHSNAHNLIQANPLIRNDELHLKSRFGLRYLHPEISVATVFDDQTSLLTYFDVDKTCESIAKISQRDADSYRKQVERTRKLLPMFVTGLFAPPPPFGTFLSMLEQSREGRALIGVMNRSAFDIIDEMFESDKLKIHCMKYSSEAMAGPEEKGTGLIFNMMVGFIHTYQGGMPAGGSAELVHSLARCIESYGGEIRTQSHVSRVILEGGRAVGVALDSGEEFRAKRAVIGAFHPHLLANYVAGIDADVIADAKRTQPGPYSSILANYALHAEPIYPALEGIPPPLMVECLPSDLQTVREEFDALRYGRMPKHPSLVCSCHTQLDPSRAPQGKSVLYMYNFAPYQLADGGPQRWDGKKEEVADWMLSGFREYTTNMGSENIIARHVSTPLDNERTSLSFQKGDISGIGRYIYQFLGRRPTPELSRYAVPGVDGLYLSGPFMHPGGGVIGGGRATAIKIMGDIGIDFDKVIAGA